MPNTGWTCTWPRASPVFSPEEMTVVTEMGVRYRYDKLLIATGGTALVPPITGAELPGVVTLRTLGDAKAH